MKPAVGRIAYAAANASVTQFIFNGQSREDINKDKAKEEALFFIYFINLNLQERKHVRRLYWLLVILVSVVIQITHMAAVTVSYHTNKVLTTH